MLKSRTGTSLAGLLSASLLLAAHPPAHEALTWQVPEGGETSREDKEAVQRIREAYAEMGYLQALVTLKESTSSTKVFEIQPGKKFLLKEVAVTGAKRFRVDELLQGAPKAGEVFRPSLLRKWIEIIAKKYGDAGMHDIEVTPDISFDRASGMITLTVEVKEPF